MSELMAEQQSSEAAKAGEESLVYLLRPGRTSIWLPRWLVRKLGAQSGDLLTEGQFADDEVQRILQVRRETERGKRAVV